jgi:hypothetical protein
MMMRRKKQLDELCVYLHEICGCSTHGGRILKSEQDDSAIVMDVPGWTHEMSACVQNRFPSACISIYSASDSLTGFNVIVKVPSPPYVSVTGGALFLAIMTLCGAIWWYILSPL